MGIAKLYGQKASGIDINGLIKDYYVYAGENINAGSFVEFVNGIAEQKNYGASETTQLSNTKYSGRALSSVELSDNKVFVSHSYSSEQYLYGMVLTINGATITKSTDTQLSTNTETGLNINLILLENGNVLVVHQRYSSAKSANVYGVVCEVSGTTITAGTDTAIVTSGRSGVMISAESLGENKAFIAHSYATNYRLYGVVVTISGTTLTIGTDTEISESSYAGYALSTTIMKDGKIFIAHSYSNSYHLYGIVVTISGTTITAGTDTALNTESYTGMESSVVELSNGNVFIAHSYSSSEYLYGIVVTISGTTITAGTDTDLSNNGSYKAYYVSVILLDNSKVLIFYNKASEILYGAVVTISGTTITKGTDTALNINTFTFFVISSVLLSNGTILVAHSSDSTNYYLNAQIFGITDNIPTNNIAIPTYETQVRKTTTSKFDGIAKTSGVGGTSTAHNQQVSIYTLN